MLAYARGEPEVPVPPEKCCGKVGPSAIDVLNYPFSVSWLTFRIFPAWGTSLAVHP